jgi:hypothetical protein
MGPDLVGDEFDETEEDEPADPQTIYDTLDDTEGTLRVLTESNDEITIEIDGGDVTITASIGRDERRMVVPRSALVEALQTIGLIERSPVE